MNTLKTCATLTCLAAASLFFQSCKKESIATNTQKLSVLHSSLPVLSEEAMMSSTADVTRAVDLATGDMAMLFRPGKKIGQDSWIDYSPSDPQYAAGMPGEAPELKAMAWTIGGSPIYSRFMIRFDSLSKVPADKKVVVAKLVLFGVTSSPVSLPQGNSSFPGSPYAQYNSLLVQRITSAWDESTISYNTKPSVTMQDEIITRASRKQWDDTLVLDVTTLVQQMVANPSQNFGFMFQIKDENTYRSWGFAASEYADPTRHPALRVIYE